MDTTNWGGLGGFRDYLIPFTAMLRSWEDRFGARLFEVGFATSGCWWSARPARHPVDRAPPA
jgi:hypothetical protein